MIIFHGIESNKDIYYISFINDKNTIVKIPIEKVSAERIKLYLKKISEPPINIIQRNNIEEEENESKG